MSVNGKKILLIITGGIAAFKALETIRLIKKAGANVTVVMTNAAKQFITPLSVAALSEHKVYDQLFNLTDETEMGHISLSRQNDLILVLPATANILAKMANGLADDLASTLLLATDSDIMVAPAMNVRMWEHAATQYNVDILKQRDIKFIGPEQGDMACGEFGYGRLSEPENVLNALNDYFNMAAKITKKLVNKHVLITAGPTYEPIDPVRFIGNLSSGKQGYAIAKAAFNAGAKVTLVTGPSNQTIPVGVNAIKVNTADEMLLAVKNALPADIAIFAAAVADWKIAEYSDKKIKKQAGNDDKTLSFTENPDILKTISNLKNTRPKLVIGFAAETNDIMQNGKVKLQTKNCDLLVINDVSPQTGTMGGDHNKIAIMNRKNSNIEHFERASKTEIAQQLINYISDYE